MRDVFVALIAILAGINLFTGGRSNIINDEGYVGTKHRTRKRKRNIQDEYYDY